MMQVLKNSLLVVLLTVAMHSVFAQNEATMYFMNSLPQVTYLNPALTPRYKFSLGLPGSSVFVQYGNNGFTYNDIATKEGGVIRADLNKLYAAMADKNYIDLVAQADLFRFSMKVNARMYLTVNTTVKTYNSIMLPKDAAGLFINGTVAYVGGTASLSPEVRSIGYVETGVGASYIVNKKLTVGARVKILKGAANATTENANVELSLDNDYAITIRASGELRSSGIHNLDDDNYDIEDNWRDYLDNNGVAFDAGATYKVTDRLTVGLSLLDIGGIRWKNDPYSYRLDPARANYTFSGVDLDRILNGDEDYLDAEGDTLESRFDVQEGAIAGYRTALPAKAYMSGSYRLARNFHAGLLLFAERYDGRFSSGVSASLCKDFGRRFTTSLSYTVTRRAFNNVGAGISLNLAPIQIYIVGDNLLRAPIALASDNLNSFVNSMHYFNLRAGFNFVFGWDKEQEKQPYPSKQQ